MYTSRDARVHQYVFQLPALQQGLLLWAVGHEYRQYAWLELAGMPYLYSLWGTPHSRPSSEWGFFFPSDS
jgi:hypothetical protein